MSTSTVVGNSEGPVAGTSDQANNRKQGKWRSMKGGSHWQLGMGSSTSQTGFCPAPPPPPPPPPVPGQVPAMRINTVEAPTIRRPQLANDGYEPPAAIQNAMLTKDKKPFTYTPGMGGKLDLSQIRSPRMARRVAKNANDEGIEGPPKSALEQKPAPVPNAAPNLFIQPQVAIPVFPTNIPVQPPANRTPPTPSTNRTPTTPSANWTPTTPTVNRSPPIVPEKQPEVVKPVTKVETKIAPLVTTSVQPGSPESPGTPTQVTLAKAPTPWLQNKNKPQEELPEWAKRPNANKQSSSPESPVSPPIYTVQQSQATPPPTQPQWQPAQQRPSQQPQPYQNPQPQPFVQQQQKRPYCSPPVSQQASPQTQERVIPIRIEDRPSVFDVKREPGHHQFKQPSPHHQQRWGQQSNPNQVQNQVQKQPANSPQPAPSSGGSYIIPIVVEGSDKKLLGGPPPNSSFSQPAMIVRNNGQGAESQTVKVIPQRGPVSVQDSGPVQSRSFRVLQKITDTDSTNDFDPEQLRKLQLLEDDRILMNKFKEQVDNENTLHYEEDPRYRGSAIPSRAFRYLQTMTDSGDVPVAAATPRQQAAINKRQNRNSKSFEEMQANLPPSEQQAPEPKKYMGSAIPSKSFRILQAMTAPESVATQENRQADYTCQTENNVPGNQQPVVLPPCPPFWTPEGGWWGYYPLPYPNDSYPYHPDNTAYVYFPIYNQNYSSYPGTSSDNTPYPYPPPYVIPVPPQGSNHRCEQGNVGATVVEPALKSQEKNHEDRSLENKSDDSSKDINGLTEWDRVNNVSRTDSGNSKDSDCTTAMNITDEEEIPETVVPEETQESSTDKLATTSLNVPVPNYTYIDTSDSSESTDSESQMESIIESSKSCSDRNSGDTSSDSEDSDSYLAYSTGLNPHGRVEKDQERIGKEDSKSSVEGSVEDAGRMNDAEGKDTTVPHQLSVIYEDAEQDFEGPRSQEARKFKDRSGTAFEATDDPPDEADDTTVSVSLPLRFKFSVSENNEDVTTVIVGDSTIKPERVCGKEEAKSSARSQEQKAQPVEVSANFLVNNDTCADFTVKRDSSDGKRRGQQSTKSVVADRTKADAAERQEDPVVPHVNFTLRKIPTRLGRINCEETVETEFTIRRRNSRKEEDCSLSTSTVTSNEDSSTISRETVIEDRSEPRDFNKNVLKPEVIVSECNSSNNDYSSTKRNNEMVDIAVDSSRKLDEERSTRDPKHLLSVQNSREETDDEDSGVTSDMSRMISEVDTDSECTSTRNMRKYQRTQTHSRLFRLLNDDSVLPEGSVKPEDSSSRRQQLSLPLKNNGFNYDESYCSNYSSGLTSPEYSPSCEQSWRLQDPELATNILKTHAPNDQQEEHRAGHPLTRQDRVACKEDPYYQAWKTSKSPVSGDHDVVPSLAFKVLESRRPPWAYKVNVLCPRIKSTKSVPRTLQQRKIDNDSPKVPTQQITEQRRVPT